MRIISLSAIIIGLLAIPAAAQDSRMKQILDRLENANQWRDHVMIVAHRGGWKEGGRIRNAENSMAGVRRSIELGVEIVELDVQKSKDGEYIVLHDSWLDRTTTCKGRAVERTLAELKDCRLVVEGTGEVTAESVPALRDMFAVTRDRVMVNIDNKMEVEDLAGVAAIAREMNMADQVIIKQNLWNSEKLGAMTEAMTAIGEGVRFMPIIADDAVDDVRFIEKVGRTFSADVVEMIAWRGENQGMTANGGALFGARSRAVSARGDWHLWVNTFTIVNKPGGYLAGGRGDELVQADYPQETFGFWAEQGATIIQTDEPKAAIEWLQKNGYRVPYAEQVEPADTASIN